MNLSITGIVVSIVRPIIMSRARILNIYSSNVLGHIYIVHPRNDKCIYLYLLLVNVPGPASFQFLRKVDSELCATCREACQCLHLLEDDHWDRWCCYFIYGTSHQIQLLFAIIISTCFPSSPYNLWNKYKGNMAEDILHQVRSIPATYE